MLFLIRPLLLVLLTVSAGAQVRADIPSPEFHFGHRMGADRKLVEWNNVARYYQRVAAASDFVKVEELGKSTEGRPFLLVTVAEPSTLRNLDRYAEIQKRLVDPRKTTPQQAAALAGQGKAVVLITCSIHSDEVASTLTAMEFLYKLLTENTERHQTILKETIFLLVPSLNPDGVDKVARWYRRYLGTPYEGAPMTELYHKYTGHDNNRDWYMFTQQETRLAVEKVHNAWHPQVVYDVHQMSSTAARMFLPPWVDPIDPNIDALIVQQVNQFGASMAVDLTAAGKKGVVIHGIYDYYTPARHYQSYHGGMRLLSESASVRYATPIRVPFSSLQTRARGYNAQQRSWNFLEPWPGGEWRLRDIVDNQLITFESCLYHAAKHRRDLLTNFYRISQRVVSDNSPSAFVIPRQQHDPNAMTRLLQTLHFGAVEIERALRGFRAGERQFQEGDYVIRMRQPFARFAKTLLERSQYPDLREYSGGPPRRPYDVTAHSLPLLLGVDVAEMEQAFRAELETLREIAPPPGRIAGSALVSLSPAQSNAWKAVNRLLAQDVPVFRNEANGEFYIRRSEAPQLSNLADELGLEFSTATASPESHRRLRTSRVGLYRGRVPIMDEGWTRWVLEQFEFPYQSVGNERLQQGGLNRDFDVIILPDASPRTLHAGYLRGALYQGAEPPPEITGGIEDSGAQALREFVVNGGTLLVFNNASEYARERLEAPVRNVLEGVEESRFYAPGSLLWAEIDTTHPLCFGMREREAVWFESGPAFRVSGGAGRAAASYPGEQVLASGWLLGERYLHGRAAVVDLEVGSGRMVLFGIRPQYRGQPNATFKMVFNGLYYW